MSRLKYLRDAAVFAPCYIVLDWVSYIHPLGPFNITPWNPQPALAIAWMMLGGLVHAPAVFGTVLLADVMIRHAPAGYVVTTVSALVLSGGYALIAWALRSFLVPTPSLRNLRQLTTFVAIVLPGTALIALLFVGGLHLAGQIPANTMLAGWLRFWVGDAVGVLVTAPLLLVIADSDGRRGIAALARRAETYAQVALIAATLWLIFAGIGGDPSHHFYLIFLPLIWIAIRHGLAGAVVAVAMIQVGVVLGIHHRPIQVLPVIELQALVAALTLTALYLGVMVDERQRANDGLRDSLRLAAAGEMAGAITHEVNQPLAALTNYGRATRVLLEAGRYAEAQETIEKMMSEALRAAEIVRRLRDFFREGTTRLERVPVAELLEAARRIGSAVKGEAGPALTIGEGTRGEVLVDRLQIELVLRNLLMNAVESIHGAPPSQGRIAVSAVHDHPGHVHIVVSDSGPGVPISMRDRVFQPFVSGKSAGMGLGLAVSRAIAEAHGGSLEVHSGAHGEFRLVLPLEAGDA